MKSKNAVFVAIFLVGVTLFSNLRPRSKICKDVENTEILEPPFKITKLVNTDKKETVWWVISIHTSGKEDRKKAVESTYGRQTSPLIAINKFSAEPGKAYLSSYNMFREMLNKYPDASWFSKFDDDSYVYTRNFAKKLSEFDLNGNKAWYLGYALKNGIVFASGGAGYTLSKQAVVSMLKDPRCAAVLSEYEDLGIGQCMSQNGIELTHVKGLHPHNHWQMLRWDKTGHPPDHVHQDEGMDGYLKPLSYHYVSPDQIVAMHDDYYQFGLEEKRVKPLPKIIHQFWVGSRFPPHRTIESCDNLHPGWDHRVWNEKTILDQFPNGQLVNQDFYDRSQHEKNLLSDIIRYEFLLFWGGVYMDADSVCVQPMDVLWRDLVTKHGTAEGFCVYENEHRRANVEGHMLIATGVLALYPFSPLAVVLVKELQRTDWGLPAWMSAGPLYATKLFARINANIHHMPSHSFYPYHFEDTPPSSRDDRLNRLREANSFTDQIWGTTRSRYMDKVGEKCPVDLLNERLSSIAIKDRWTPSGPMGNLLSRYTQLHARLMTAPLGSRVRYVVASISKASNVCELKLGIMSALLLAVLTDRALLFDWQSSDFYKQFNVPPIAFGLNDATRYIGSSVTDNSVSLEFPDSANRLKNDYIDSVYVQETLQVVNPGQWGSILFSNPHYRYDLKGISQADGFSALSQYLFRPVSASPVETCIEFSLVTNTPTPEKTNSPSGAFLYYAFDADMEEMHKCRMTLFKNHEFFNSQHHYPVVIVANNIKEWYHLSYDNTVKLIFIEVGKEQQKSRYASGHLFSHPDLERFDHVIRIDGDMKSHRPWTSDPFLKMKEGSKKVGSMAIEFGNQNGTDGIWEAFEMYLKEKRLSMKQPDLILDDSGKYKHTRVRGCFTGVSTSFFRDAKYADLFNWLDKNSAVFQNQWNEEQIVAFYAALYLNKQEMEMFDYI